MIQNEGGITLLEVIVAITIAAVIGVLTMAWAMNYFRNQEFRGGIKTLTSTINDLLNDISNGKYVDIKGIKCIEKSGVIDYEAQPNQEVGYNDDCLFLGKSIQFGSEITGETLGDDLQQYTIHNLIGLKSANDSGLQGVEVLYNPSNPTVDVSETEEIQFGVSISKIFIEEPDQLNPAKITKQYLQGIAILQTAFGEQKTEQGEFLSGGRQISIRPIIDTKAADLTSKRWTIKEYSENYGNNIDFYNGNLSRKIFICMHDSRDRYGYIRVGSSKGTLKAVFDLEPNRAKDKCDVP